jgi:hypothetical protein
MKRYVVSSYIPNADINAKCLNALAYYANHIGAKLVIGECHPNYKNDMTDPVQEVIKEELGKIIIHGDFQINNNLSVTGFRQSINVIDPLQGMESLVAKMGCLIVPFPRHRFKMVPRMLKDNKAPRAIWCSGTISEAYYKNSKSGIRMKEYHQLGGLIVEVINDNKFNIRQLQFDGEGFYDLTSYYTSTSVSKTDSIDAIVLGDDHAAFLNPKVLTATKKLLRELNPKKVFHHDTLDCMSISHHTLNKNITRAKINTTLMEELRFTSNYYNDIMGSTEAEHYLVASNHLEHLDKYLEEVRYKEEPCNHEIGLELALAKVRGKNPVEVGLRLFNNLDRLHVMTRNDSLKVNDWEMLCHGDYGSNGSKGTPVGIANVYGGKVVSGHVHSPEISVLGSVVVGTMTDLNLPYTNASGGSSWLNTHCLCYNNGTVSHFHILPE